MGQFWTRKNDEIERDEKTAVPWETTCNADSVAQGGSDITLIAKQKEANRKENQTEMPLRKKMRIYTASSWRNVHYEGVVTALRDAGFDVYDFRNPSSDDEGFKWEYVSADYMEWTPEQYRDMLHHEKAERQFANDIKAMESCDACVLILPCGRSAHTEAGWFAGKGKKVIAYIPERQEPELMYKLFTGVACSIDELLNLLLH